MKRLPYLLFAVWVVALASAPFLASNYIVKIATFLAMYAALALSWNFIGGYAGYPSFSTAAFFGLGAYSGALMQNAGLGVGVAWVGGAVVTTAFAALLGFAILRMRGHYFAIASIALVEVLMLVASTWAGLTGGGEGLNVKIMPGGPDYIGRVFLYTMLAIMIAAFIATVLVDRGRLGFGLRCIQQNEDAADMVGVDVTRYKTAAFALSAVFCGAIGAAYASWVAYISPVDSFSILMTLKVPVMVLLGGPGTVFGPVIGSAVFVLMEETIWAKFLDYHQAILGIVIVLLIFFLPGGLLRLFRQRGAA
jgi:branched-chain amino acid transport system permease protein